MNDQPDDRFGLDAFDGVDAPDQWDEITARADGTTSAAVGDAGRRGPAVWFMSAAAAVLIVVAVIAVAARSGDEVTTPATTPDDTVAPPTDDTVVPTTPPTTPAIAPPTTAPGAAPVVPPPTVSTVPPTSAPSTTAPDDGAPDSTVPVLNEVDVWNPVCVERYGDDLSPAVGATTFDDFTTVGSEPALDISIPEVPVDQLTDAPLLAVTQVPGGIFVAAYATAVDAGTAVDVTTLAVIDLDGSVRWRRCLAEGGLFAGLLGGTDGQSRVVFNDYDTTTSAVRSFDLRNGLDLGTTALDRVVVSVAGDVALATVPWTDEPVGVDDDMLLVSPSGPESVPYPDAAIGLPIDTFWYEPVDLDGDSVLTATGLSSATPDFVYLDGSWSGDPDDLRMLPPKLKIGYDADDPGLQLLDGAGDAIWTVPDFHTISREGFNSAVTDSVVLAMDCPSWTEENSCAWVGDQPPEERLVAYDVETGDELWSRPGARAFAAIDGDRGIMIDDLDGDGELDGWRLIDLRTGDVPADETVTEWPRYDIFFNECCGAGDYVWTRLDGGVLFESTGDHLRVWLPPEVTTETASVDLSA